MLNEHDLEDMRPDEPAAMPMLTEERARWFSLVMGAAASLEDAANHLRDKDAQRIALSAAEHYRKQANAPFAAPQPSPEPKETRHALG